MCDIVLIALHSVGVGNAALTPVCTTTVLVVVDRLRNRAFPFPLPATVERKGDTLLTSPNRKILNIEVRLFRESGPHNESFQQQQQQQQQYGG